MARAAPCTSRSATPSSPKRSSSITARRSLRLWSASVEFHEDVRVSDTILTRLQEAYRKLRNTFRYLLGNLSGFRPAHRRRAGRTKCWSSTSGSCCAPKTLVARCRAWYDEFAFHKVYRALYDFATVDLSSLYFDVLKDRLYTAAAKSHARRSAQTALYRLEYALVRLVAPILTFTAEEVWTHMGQSGSVHLALFPGARRTDRGPVRCSPETRRQLGPSHGSEGRRAQEPRGGPPGEVYRRAPRGSGTPDRQRRSLPAARRIRQRTARRSSSFRRWNWSSRPGAGVSVQVERADGVKCERCWKYTTDTGSDPRFPTICAACAGAMRRDACMADQPHESVRPRRDAVFAARPPDQVDHRSARLRLRRAPRDSRLLRYRAFAEPRRGLRPDERFHLGMAHRWC